MKRFCFKVGLFAVLQVAVFAVLLWNYDVADETNYLAATVDKHARLSRTAPPRVILVGGSNVPFGIHSDFLEAALGRRVVNMGLAAGAGIDFMLSEIESSLREGDIILLSLEYDRLAGGFDPGVLQQLLVYRPANVMNLGSQHFKRVLLDRGLMIVGSIVRRALDSFLVLPSATSSTAAHAPRGFNEWGDLTVHYGQPGRITPETANGGKLFPDRRVLPSREVRSRLENFARNCHRRGALVAFSFPPFPRQPLQADAQAVSDIASVLQKIPHLKVLDSPMDQVYDAALFYDTGYHLNQNGGEQRTAKLAKSLQLLIQNSQAEEVK